MSRIRRLSPEITLHEGDARYLARQMSTVILLAFAVPGAALALIYCYHNIRPRHAHRADPEMILESKAPVPAFKTRRLNGSTFLITEWDDIWNEHPYIYAKVVRSANTILILDTGCGGATTNSSIGIRSLREYLETVPIKENRGRALNEGGTMKYVVTQTHCHYDHICTSLGILIDTPGIHGVMMQWVRRHLRSTARSLPLPTVQNFFLLITCRPIRSAKR